MISMKNLLNQDKELFMKMKIRWLTKYSELNLGFQRNICDF